MAGALTVQQSKTVRSLLANNIKRIEAVLPETLTPKKMLGIAYLAIEKNPKIAECGQVGLVNAIIEASSLGLPLGGPRPLAHLLPFKDKKKGTMDVTLVVDYKGFIDLAFKSDQIASWEMHPVYKKDTFSFRYGVNRDLIHVPSKDPDRIGRENLTHAYVIVRFVNGGYDFEVADRSIVMAAKERSPAKNSNFSPWNGPDEWTMWCKTPARIIAKRVPMSPELKRAAYLDEKAAIRMSQGLNHVNADMGLEELPQGGNEELTDKINSIDMILCADTEKEIPAKDCEKCKKRDGCPALD